MEAGEIIGYVVAGLSALTATTALIANFKRQGSRDGKIDEKLETVNAGVKDIKSTLNTHDTILLGIREDNARRDADAANAVKCVDELRTTVKDHAERIPKLEGKIGFIADKLTVSSRKRTTE